MTHARQNHMKPIHSVLLLLTLAGSAWGQEKVLIINGTTMLDAVKSLELVRNGSADDAIANRVKLQARFDAGAPKYPLFFPGAVTDNQRFNFDDTVTIPTSTGWNLSGIGFTGPEGTPAADYDSRLSIRAISKATTFDGSTNKLTASGAGTTVTVTGRAVTSRDVYNSVYISGGTGVTPGWYGINSVVEGASGVGTWTLDRAWCTGAVTAGTGYYCPAIICDKSQGTTVQNLGFTGSHLTSDTPVAQVLYHVLTNEEGLNTGKHVFRQCSFGDSEVGILCGKHMASSFDDGSTVGLLWDGHDGLHADNLTLDKMNFVGVNYPVVIRNLQSVGHVCSDLHIGAMDGSAFYFESGNRLSCRGLKLSGGSGTQNALRLGNRVVDGTFALRDVWFDSTNKPQLLRTTWSQNHRAQVVFDGVQLRQNSPTAPTHFLVDASSGVRVTLLNVWGDGDEPYGIWPNSVKLTFTSSIYKPHMLVGGSVLNVTTNAYEILDASCTAGIDVEFVGNCKVDGTALRSGRYVTGTGWDTTNSGYSYLPPDSNKDLKKFYAAIGLPEPGHWALSP